MTNSNLDKFYAQTLTIDEAGTGHLTMGVWDLFGICHLGFSTFYNPLHPFFKGDLVTATLRYGIRIQTFSIKMETKRRNRLARVG